MISNKVKVGDHRPETVPSRELRGFDDEPARLPVASMYGSTTFASFTKSLFRAQIWLHPQDGMLFIEGRIRSSIAPYDRCRFEGQLADGVHALSPPSTLRWLVIDRQGIWTPASKPQCPSAAAPELRVPAEWARSAPPRAPARFRATRRRAHLCRPTENLRARAENKRGVVRRGRAGVRDFLERFRPAGTPARPLAQGYRRTAVADAVRGVFLLAFLASPASSGQPHDRCGGRLASSYSSWR